LRLKKGEFKARKGDFGQVLNSIQSREALVKNKAFHCAIWRGVQIEGQITAAPPPLYRLRRIATVLFAQPRD